MSAPVLEESPWPAIDTRANQLIACFGRKGSGKSVAARMLFRSWPDVDKVTIDVNGDADPGPDAVRVTGEPPSKLPARGDDGRPVNLWYVADPERKEYRDDLDRAVGLALFPQDRRTLLWVDEIGEVTQKSHTPPRLRKLLQQSRHYHASALMCGPRPMNVDPLVLQQADRVLLFDLPNPDDREKVAKTIGWPLRHLEESMATARAQGRYWFLMYVAGDHELFLCPPLPSEWL